MTFNLTPEQAQDMRQHVETSATTRKQLRSALAAFTAMDPCDAVHDAELLVAILTAECAAILKRT